MIYNLQQLRSVGCFMLVLASMVGLQSCHPSKPTSAEALKAFESIIPKPVSAKTTGETFFLTKASTIAVAGSEEVLSVATFLKDKIKIATELDLAIAKDTAAYGAVYLTTQGANAALGEEGYTLTVTVKQIRITATTPQGLFRGIQTLLQIIPVKNELNIKGGSWEIATGTIVDKPSYAWRGSMLDVARHFFSVDDVKRYIDLIAAYKMNVMHLHLSDDQGWRIEIKSWPNLTAIGGSTQVGGGKGGFYTQEQYADIVAYAQQQYITIIPEIDLPGHINAALSSYAELNVGTPLNLEGTPVNPASPAEGTLNEKPKPGKIYTGIEVGFSTLNIKKEVTFTFVDDVLRELAAITPGPYLHIGGDEAAATKKEDYIAFINRFETMVKAHGKKMIGWEEIAQANINSNAIAQHWHSIEYAQLAEEKGAKLILSPATKVYLDMQYDSMTKLGLHWAAYIEVDDAYNWDPSTLVEGVAHASILGVEAPLWGETIVTMDDIEFLLFPRLPAIAEVGWTPVADRNWDTFKVRLGNQARRWKSMDVNYYHSPLVPWVE